MIVNRLLFVNEPVHRGVMLLEVKQKPRAEESYRDASLLDSSSAKAKPRRWNSSAASTTRPQDTRDGIPSLSGARNR